jgi:hypothetical protein
MEVHLCYHLCFFSKEHKFHIRSPFSMSFFLNNLFFRELCWDLGTLESDPHVLMSL